MRAWAVGLLLAALVGRVGWAQSDGRQESFAEALTKLAGEPDDPCGESNSRLEDAGARLEGVVFARASEAVVEALNRTEVASEGMAARERVETVLKELARQSAETNGSWPEEARFHGQVFEMAPVLVLTIGLRTHERFFVFGVSPISNGKPERRWRILGEDDEEFTHPAPRINVSVYPLHRGPSGRVRFVASFFYSGCAGSSGLNDEIEELDPSAPGTYVSSVLTLDGAMGMDEAADGGRPTAKEPFHPIGRLRTQGRRITLPYCWWSALDTWDNPSMCAVETYDVSGNDVLFVGREYNRPELAPIAKALEYAGKHDLPAVRGYCASEKIARKLVRDGGSGHAFEDGFAVRKRGPGRVRVEPEEGDGVYFDVEKRRGGWVIVGFGATETKY